MENEVKLINNPDFTCSEKVIATIAHWYGRATGFKLPAESENLEP